MFSKKMIFMVFLFFLLLSIASPVFAESLQVIDAGSAWPSNVVGVYTADGSFNGKTCYRGPDGYWLYQTEWSGLTGWFIGKPLGESEINSTEVRFYSFTTADTPPLNVNFTATNNALGSVQVTTGGGTPPSVPSGIFTHTATTSSFTSSWSDIPDATGYKLEVSTADNFSSFVTNYGPFVITIPEGTPFANRPRNHVVSGLAPGTTYYFRMKSFNGFGDSSPSVVSSITTVPAAPVVQPASDISDVSFQANWSSQSGATHYLLYVSLNSDLSSPFVDGQFVSTSHHPVTGLNANTSYYYRVKAVNASGQSDLSSIQQVTTGPSKPSALEASMIQTNAFTANWTAVPEATAYYLDVATDGSFNHTLPAYTAKSLGNVTSHVVDQALLPHTAYHYRIRSGNALGTSSNSNIVSVTTAAVLPEVTTDSVTLTAPAAVEMVGTIITEGQPALTQHGFVWNTLPNPTTAHSKTEMGAYSGTTPFTSITDLSYETTYYIRAYAQSNAGTVYGAQLEVTTEPEKVPLTIKVQDADKIYGAADPSFSVSYNGFVGDDTSEDLTGTLTFSREEGETIGLYVVSSSGLSSDKYDIIFQPGNLAIVPRPLTVIADSAEKIYGQDDPLFSYQLTSGELVGSDAFTGSLSRDTGEDTGSYLLHQGSLSAGDNYLIHFVDAALTIAPKPLTVTADSAEKIYGQDDPLFSYQLTSGELVGSDAFTGSLSRDAGEDAGSYLLHQGSLSAGDNYLIHFVDAALTIAPKPLTVTADSAEKIYGQDDPLFSYQLTSGELVGSDAFTGSLSRDAGEDAGSYSLHQGSLSAGDNYLIHFVDAALTIAPKPLTVTADSADKIYGQDDPLFSYQLTSGELVGSDAFTGSLSRDAGEDAGSYSLHQGSLSAGDNYLIHFVDAALTIAPKPLTVTADSAEKIYGQDDPLFTVAYTGFVFDDTPAALHGELLFVREPGNDIGTYTITPTGLTSFNYEITFIPGILTISLYHPKLQDLKISQGIMNPTFNPNVTNYQVSVAHHISSLTLTPFANNLLEVIHINGQPAVSGQLSRSIPLSPGLNAITISIATADGLHQETYHLAVSRASAAASDSESTSSSPPTSQPQPHSKLFVKLNQALSGEGTARFTATINAQEVSNVIQTLKANGLSNLMILTEAESGATASVIDIHVPERTLVELSENNISLEIATAFGSLEIPVELLTSLIDQAASLSITIEKIPPHESVVARQLAAATGNTPLGEDTQILTNISGRTRVTLSLSGIDMPVDSDERHHLLSSLAVFVYHSDATTEVIEGTIQYDDAGNPVSISIWVNHFSTFVIVKLPEDGIQLFIDSKVAIFNGIEFSLDAAPLIDSKTNRTLVPVRFTSEMLGADVQWFADLKQVHITDNDRQIILTIDSDRVLLNGTEHRLDCAATIIDGRMYVPLRFISETLGALVEWNGAAKSIIIKK
ncbi:MBG domain-containing protein [Anoxynatronum buryatiense]|uniref:Cadherin-like beta sandwich domain-containing protein n=1 Tax=Anoxynatronum buryatiense TaxID=489973 RepID=A0AA46AK05_9CLOT|nr:MBG domain-containing protein [Anoxynatronum buryatiense]SMP66308.1 Cadherin-like beta sandwich domain-containing protein [Anoxynatronum buryatiense]